MSVTLELSDGVVAHLRREAGRRGISLDKLVADLAALLPPSPEPHKGRSLGFIGIGASDSGSRAADADKMLAEGFGRT